MSLTEGNFAFVPSELTFGRFEISRQYDSASDTFYRSITLTDRAGKKNTLPEDRARDVGLRGPLPLPVAELMLNVIGSRTAPVLGGSAQNRAAFKYPPILKGDAVFGPARVLRDLEERYRRSAKRRRADAKLVRKEGGQSGFYRIKRTDLTPEDPLRHNLARYIAAEIAGARAEARRTPVTNSDFDKALHDVDYAMMFGSPFTLQMY